MKSWLVAALCAVPLAAGTGFQFRDVDGRSLELTDNGEPVFVYNYGTMLKDGVPADRARCCYLHPVWAPNGVVITDDFPRDHYHHRGISWMWPVVKVDGKIYDLWTIKGILARFEKWTRKEGGPDQAVVAFQDGWYIGDRKVVEEQVEIVAHPARKGRRDLDFALQFRAAGDDVVLVGEPAQNKGYGGFNIRFAARTGTAIAAPGTANVPDSDMQPRPWAELTGDFGGKRAGARISIDPSNAGPSGWCLRHYGFLGVNYPGLEPYRLSSRAPLAMKFRVVLVAEPAKVLVYTRNFVTSGKGYVHENIATSVEAIRTMGGYDGFAVDASDDPAVFSDANLKQYRTVVFANSNNEAFATDAQRAAFRRYIQAGGGFVGIHSASGSEREWPYFWSLLGGKFVRHPKLQPFQVRVEDRAHAATKDLPASFEWTDECYYFDHLNPGMRVLLSADPATVQDPKRPEGSLPLAWYQAFDGGREFYVALGHRKEDYANPFLFNLIRGGITWAMYGN